MSTTSTQYQATKQGGPFALVSVPKPVPEANEVSIRLKAIALAPLDVKQLDYGMMVEKWPAVFGYDGAGVIEAVGQGVTKFKVGESVLSFFGPTPKAAAFQEIAVVPQSFVAKKPENVSFEDAASLPVAYCTAVWAIYSSLKIAIPHIPETAHSAAAPPKSVLVLGGSSGVGASAVQILRLALPSATILTTSSTQHHAHLATIGATKAFDQRSATLIADIKSASPGGKGVDAIIDAVGSGATQKNIFEALSPDGPKHYAEVQTGAQIAVPEGVKRTEVMVFTAFQSPVGASLLNGLTELLASGQYKLPVRVKTVGKGLDAIGKGLDELRAGVSGTKLVVSV